MDRRCFLRSCGAVAGAALPGLRYCLGGDRRRRPDVLFIAIEDIAPFMGCYGHPVVKTPNIDALAERGVLFHNAYCQTAVCNPSRASVTMGLRPETTGVYVNNADWRRRIPEGNKTMAEYFRDAGYETAICGKIHHHQRYYDDAWDKGQEREDAMWTMRVKGGGRGQANPGQRPKAPRPDWLEPDHYIAKSLNWGESGLTDEKQSDGAMARAVAAELNKPHDKPLYMAVGFHCPHYALRAPKKYVDMYPPDELELPKNPPGDLDDVPHEYSSFNTADDRWLDADEKRQVLGSYYACISYIDACVGVLMEALEKSGKADETIVCLWGDHGMHFGEHFLYRKYTLYENAARVPFIMVAPGVSRAGAVCRRPVELLDIYPTLADLAGLGVPDALDGISMKPLLLDPDRKWKEAAFTCRNARDRSLRTQRWRYTEWGGPDKAELYDHENDPGEFTNLANDPKYAKVVKELSRLLKKAGGRT